MECNEIEQENLRGLIGQICWLGRNTRPDMSYDVLVMSCTVNQHKVENINTK